MSSYFEYNFDGLPGPTHSNAGLSHGNRASESNRARPANPRAAALQGLEKMKRLHDAGLKQAFFPPQFRPELNLLRNLGFFGTPEKLIATALEAEPGIVAAITSSSFMWTANAATVCPSPDSADGRVHLTVANRSSNLHRSLEPSHTEHALKHIFPDTDTFHVHPALEGGQAMSDEGAANHTRLAPHHGARGIHLFVHGREALNANTRAAPKKYPARQTLEANRALARLAQLPADQCCFLQQSPEAIDAGVFHNDVIATGNESFHFFHEDAFADGAAATDYIAKTYERLGAGSLTAVEVPRSIVSLEDAVRSYLFNSQILSLPEGGMRILAPSQCETITSVRTYLEACLEDAQHPITSVEFVDLGESMSNGGGPACLRLRVVLSEAEAQKVHPGVRFDEQTYEKLKNWITRSYRDHFRLDDLRDPQMHAELNEAFAQLESLIGLPGFYTAHWKA